MFIKNVFISMLFKLIYGIKTSMHLLWINPIWTGLFANLKRLRGQNAPHLPNLAISSYITMKIGRGILWVEIFTN